MEFKFPAQYDKAVKEGLLPGFAIMAATKDEVIHSQAGGVRSQAGPDEPPFQTDSLAYIASMTKLITAVLVMQIVEKGLLDLDDPAVVARLIPAVSQHGVIKGFDEATDAPIIEPVDRPITVRMLLNHTYGGEYDFANPLLMKLREQRGEVVWAGPGVEVKSGLPLLAQPGTTWAYSPGLDWAGLLLERLTGQTLDERLATCILGPLGIAPSELTFWPDRHAGALSGRRAMLSTLADDGSPPARDFSEFDLLGGATECIGGGGAYATASAYLALLQAVLRRDARVMGPDAWAELFRPQLGDDPRVEDSLNEFVGRPWPSGMHELALPANLRKSWCLAGMVCVEAREGVVGNAGTVIWAGVPSEMWFIDPVAGVCGVCCCQIFPPMLPAVFALHQAFREEVCQSRGR